MHPAALLLAWRSHGEPPGAAGSWAVSSMWRTDPRRRRRTRNERNTHPCCPCRHPRASRVPHPRRAASDRAAGRAPAAAPRATAEAGPQRVYLLASRLGDQDSRGVYTLEDALGSTAMYRLWLDAHE